MVTFEAFALSLHQKMGDPRFGDAFGDAFDLFDVDKRGELSKGDLIDGMLKLGETLTDIEAEEMLKITKKKDDFVKSMTTAVQVGSHGRGAQLPRLHNRPSPARCPPCLSPRLLPPGEGARRRLVAALHPLLLLRLLLGAGQPGPLARQVHLEGGPRDPVEAPAAPLEGHRDLEAPLGRLEVAPPGQRVALGLPRGGRHGPEVRREWSGWVAAQRGGLATPPLPSPLAAHDSPRFLLLHSSRACMLQAALLAHPADRRDPLARRRRRSGARERCQCQWFSSVQRMVPVVPPGRCSRMRWQALPDSDQLCSLCTTRMFALVRAQSGSETPRRCCTVAGAWTGPGRDTRVSTRVLISSMGGKDLQVAR